MVAGAIFHVVLLIFGQLFANYVAQPMVVTHHRSSCRRIRNGREASKPGGGVSVPWTCG